MSLPVPAASFYAEYHGHPIVHLRTVITRLREEQKAIVWLAGDSSLDNKHWLFKGGNKIDPRHLADSNLSADACNGYEHILEPRRMIRDVAYWLNAELSGTGLCCVNASVEESTLEDRQRGLKEHDMIIRECLRPADIIVTSVGGNDVALRPSAATRMCIMQLLTSPKGSDKHVSALQHFIDLFQKQTEEFISQLIANTTPRAVIVCMLYYLDETPGSGWCEGILSQLRYNEMPGILQGLIHEVYEVATKKVNIPGTQVIPLPLFTVLDGKTTTDYCQRVEPSVQGGEKMARLIAGTIREAQLADKKCLAKDASCTLG